MQLSYPCQRFVKFFVDTEIAVSIGLEWSPTGVPMSSVSIDQTVLSYNRDLCFAGAHCELRTNSCELAYVLELLSIQVSGSSSSRFSMRVVVNDLSVEAAGQPHFRGLHHVVTASFGTSNLFVFDVLRRTLSATISGVVARDSQFWKEKLIPITLGVLGAAIGLVPMHCACLELDNEGLLIAGVSGAGKSTLSVALSQGGFNYVSDDWTYMSQRDGRLVAHGTSAPVKLLPDAVNHFQALQKHSLQTSMNGELAYEVDIVEAFGAQVERGCEPRWLIFLERTPYPGGEFTSMSATAARSYLNSSVERLPPQLSKAAEMREHIIEKVSQLPSWRFRYGGTPQFATEQLREFVLHRRQAVYA
jgi:hypothetical protein